MTLLNAATMPAGLACSFRGFLQVREKMSAKLCDRIGHTCSPIDYGLAINAINAPPYLIRADTRATYVRML